MIADQAQRLRELARERGVGSPRIMAVTSGKGGVGKTNITVNLAIALAKRGKRVLILDADIGMANVDVLIGETPRYTIQHVVRDKKSIESVAVRGPAGIYIIPGVSGTMGYSDLSDVERGNLLRAMDRYQADHQFDFVLIDTGAGMSANVVQFVYSADDVILVTTPEPTAMMDGYAMLKTLVRRSRSLNIRLLVNMATKAEGDHVYQTFATISERFLQMVPSMMGYIPRDPDLTQAVRKQVPFIQLNPSGPAAEGIQRIVTPLVPLKSEIPVDGRLRRLFEMAWQVLG